jgi:hypothetical protein
MTGSRPAVAKGATFMRTFTALLLCSVIAVCSGFAQSGNTTAGLAGVGAGAALAAGSSNGTTPSSVAGGGAGGGSAPIEIQVMAFNGLRIIAKEIAEITKNVCSPPFDRDSEYVDILRAIEKAAEDGDTNQGLATLNSDIEALAKDDIEISRDRKYYEELKEDLNKAVADRNNGRDIATLRKDIKVLGEAADKLKDRICAVLVEDTTSSNQIGLYHAVQGYYEQLQLIHDTLQNIFPLLITLPSPSFSANSGSSPTQQTQRITVKNIGTKPVLIGNIVVVDTNSGFDVGNPAVCNPLPANNELVPNASCQISATFRPSPNTPTGTIKTTLNIFYGQNLFPTPYVLSVQLTGTVTQVSRGPAGAAPPSSGGTTPGAASAGGAPAATPLGLTYLGDIISALGSAKASNTYASSSFQPTTQAFETLVETELKHLDIMPYTSTSALNLKEASIALTLDFGKMLAWGSDVTAWTNLCKPANVPTGQGSNPQVIVTSSSACNDGEVNVDLAVAQQIINGYTTLLSTANDGSGNPVIVDVLRGRVLSDKIAGGIPSLQVAVAAAGGSSKTNSPFFLGLFYQWAPSYNAGVIATFELRDKNNVLVDSGARNVLYGYKKWNPGSFSPDDVEKKTDCTFCSSK